MTIDTRSEISCDAADFVTSNEVVCREGGEVVFHRTWERRIPRDGGLTPRPGPGPPGHSPRKPASPRPLAQAAATEAASLGEAYSVPHTNRITGPKDAAAGRPVKYRPGTVD